MEVLAEPAMNFPILSVHGRNCAIGLAKRQAKSVDRQHALRAKGMLLTTIAVAKGLDFKVLSPRHTCAPRRAGKSSLADSGGGTAARLAVRTGRSASSSANLAGFPDATLSAKSAVP